MGAPVNPARLDEETAADWCVRRLLPLGSSDITLMSSNSNDFQMTKESE